MTLLFVGCRNSGESSEIESAAPPPNVIVIMADDLGYGDISAFNSGRHSTPHLERMAREGMTMTDFHTSAPVCSPTRASLVTGRYQQRAGIPGVIRAPVNRKRHHGLHQKEFTFAELAQEAGYATGLVGKWHLGYYEPFNPTKNGFELFRGFVSGNVDYFTHIDATGVPDWWDGAERIEEEGYTTHLITKHAVRFIEENRSEPFVLYVAHEAPHFPFQGPDDEPIRNVGEGGFGPKDPNVVRPRYREMIAELDQGIGEILDTLRRLDLHENTMVFFFSDNGPLRPYGSAGDLRGFKGSLFEGGHRVPFIAWWPGHVEPGSTSDETAVTFDLLATIADLIGSEPPEEYEGDGISILPALYGNELPDRRLFWSWEGQEAVRDGRYKLIRNGSDANSISEVHEGVRFYDLSRDLAETNDIAAEHPDLVDELVHALDAWHIDVETGATVQPERPEDA